MKLSRFLIGFIVGLCLQGALTAIEAAPGYQITLNNTPPFYRPASAQVSQGTVIQWHNPTPTHHTITHDDCVRANRCLFNSDPIPPNGSYTVPGLPPGRYPYHCQLHPFMRGVITVVGSLGPAERT
jgi:plastocyanin